MIISKSKYKKHSLIELDQIIFPELSMRKNKKIVDKTFEFSLKVLELYIDLLKNNEFDLSEKVLRSGTSIRECVETSFSALNKQDFINGLSVASKEALETRYWLKLIQMKHFVSNNALDDCVDQINEIINILNFMIRDNNKHKINLHTQNLN